MKSTHSFFTFLSFAFLVACNFKPQKNTNSQSGAATGSDGGALATQSVLLAQAAGDVPTAA